MTKRMNRKDRQGVLHYITINVRDKMKPFVSDQYARTALEELRIHCDQHPAKLIAYVVMPTHAHVIVNPRDGRINHFLSQYKAAVTNAVYLLAETAHQQAALDWLRMTDGQNHLWQEGKHDLYLYTLRMIWQKIDYIHNNPVKWGLVRHAYQYPYSSFIAMYQPDQPSIIPLTMISGGKTLPS